MKRQLFVTNAIYLNAYPTTTADVRRAIELLGRLADQHFLNANRRRHGDGDVAVVMMIVREPREDFLADEPGRFAVRNLLPRSRQSQANSPHSLDRFVARG